MLNLAVVESRWWESGNLSVRGLFETIAACLKENPDAYHYEMFNNGNSLGEVITRIARKPHIRNLYIAAHGDESGIYGAEAETNENNRISRAVLGNILEDIPRRSLSGLYLGTCLTANLDTVNFLLDRGSVSWIAGFSESIGWLEGSSVDLYFWTTYFARNRSGGELARIRRTAENMAPIEALCRNLGFNIFVRQRGRSGGISTLLNYP